MLQKDGEHISFPRPTASRSPTHAHRTQVRLSIHVICPAPRGWVVVGKDGKNGKGEFGVSVPTFMSCISIRLIRPEFNIR